MGCLASAVAGMTWWTETVRHPDLVASFFVMDCEVTLLVDRDLLLTATGQGIYWRLKGRVSKMVGWCNSVWGLQMGE